MVVAEARTDAAKSVFAVTGETPRGHEYVPSIALILTMLLGLLDFRRRIVDGDFRVRPTSSAGENSGSA
jgi:hypothetical protein